MVLERDITPAILRAIRDDERFSSCAIEIKKCDGWTLNANALKEHQRRNLTIAHDARLYYKIGDDSIGQKPFDAFVLKGAEAYLVIYFTKVREAWAIPIQHLKEGAVKYEWVVENGTQIIL